jgi:hypothetical protein
LSVFLNIETRVSSRKSKPGHCEAASGMGPFGLRNFKQGFRLDRLPAR